MQRHLATRRFFVGQRVSIADLALYAYTHVADQAGFTLSDYPAVCERLARVRALRRYTPMLEPAPHS